MASSLCDTLLTSDILMDCVNATFEAQNKAWVLNYDDVDATDGINVETNEVATITLREGKRGYKLEQLGKKPFGGSNSALVVGTYISTFTHQVKLYIPYTPTANKTVRELMNARLVVVVKEDVGTTKRVYGIENGLYCTECSRTEHDDDTQGGWVMTLEETKSLYPSLYYDAEDSTMDDLCKVTA